MSSVLCHRDASLLQSSGFRAASLWSWFGKDRHEQTWQVQEAEDNSLLQFRGKKAATTTGRFLVNSTIGLVGLFDPATSMGLKRQNEDFGQTLGHWGVDSGPYVVLPVLGPNTARGTGGIAVDTSVHIPLIDQVQLDSATELGTDMLKGVDTRHRQSFRYYQSGYPFEYSVVRFVIRKKTELSVLK